jgi:alpha-galactosidase
VEFFTLSPFGYSFLGLLMRLVPPSKRSSSLLSRIAFACLLAPSAILAQQPSTANQVTLLHSNSFSVSFQRGTGTLDIEWRDGNKLRSLGSGAILEDGRKISSIAYQTHSLEKGEHVTSPLAAQVYIIRSTSAGMPTLLQHLWLYDARPALAIDAELVSDKGSIGTRHFDAVVLQGPHAVDLGSEARLRVLHVPFDNDMWFRYNSVPVATMKDSQLVTSSEVTAIYDNKSRAGLVLGSITHDTWKTAIEARAQGGQLANLDLFGGIFSPTGIRTDTHDTLPHGIVRGSHITSPRILIGSFVDWRDGLDAYGAVNAAIHPPLKWAAGAPAGWNSWAAYADKINDHRYLASATYVNRTLVPLGFGKHKVIYINLDAFWSNLDAVQLSDAVTNIRNLSVPEGSRFAPGIYWTPFAYWSDDLDAYVEDTGMKYRYREILLKAPDGSMLPKVDGGLAIDPSHPGAKARTTYFLQQFQRMGFEYLKIDFLSHGALEGLHFDPSIQTGIQAYNLGMKQIVDETAGHMSLSLSIAPLFPSGYGNARRLSCDTKGHINGQEQSTEYMLNSLTYGWWANKNLYITDRDHVVLGEKADQGSRTIVEGKSRLLSAIISGGMVLDSSRLVDDPQGRELAKSVYETPKWFAASADGVSFRPIEGDTGDKAAEAFVRATPHGAYVALFNYDDQHLHTFAVPLSRIDKAAVSANTVAVTEVASGFSLPSSHQYLNSELPASASTLV